LIPRLAMQVDTPEEARRAVDEVVGKGADVIKLGVDHLPDQAPRIGGEVLAAVVDEARRRGVRAVAHIGTVEDALDAARAGVAAWMHGVYKEHIADETIPVLAGFHMQAGVFPGAGLHRELHLLAESGLTPAQAIRAATLDAARFLADGKEPDFGVVAEGKRADLLLVDGDPTQDLDALARIRAVIKGGVVLERRAISAG